jgi:RNA polymerase sigma factor (sigma-70 family)
VVLGSRADAEDAVDEVMLELLSKWPDVAGKPSPQAYAWTVVKSRTIDAARARSRRPEAMDLTAFDALAVHTADDPTEQMLTNMTIQQAIGQLPDRQRDVWVLRFSLGYSTRQTANLLAISEATVNSTVRDAKRRLARALGVALEERTPR